MTSSLTERQASIARDWDRYGDHPLFDASRLQYGRLVFSPLHHFYASCFDRLEKGLPSALDLGCGSGDNLVRLLQIGVVSTGTGVDISETNVANAHRLREHFGIPADRLRLSRGSLETADFSERFSLIIATQIVGYLEDTADFIRRASRFAAPGAYLFVSDRHRRSLTPVQALKNHAGIRRMFGKPPLELLRDDVRVHPLAELERHAAAAGFQPLWRRFGLHPISALGHNAACALNARRYEPGARRAVSAAVYGALTRIRRLEDAALAPLPTGYLYAVLFRKSGP